eukprot:gene17263-biopygen8501
MLAAPPLPAARIGGNAVPFSSAGVGAIAAEGRLIEEADSGGRCSGVGRGGAPRGAAEGPGGEGSLPRHRGSERRRARGARDDEGAGRGAPIGASGQRPPATPNLLLQHGPQQLAMRRRVEECLPPKAARQELRLLCAPGGGGTGDEEEGQEEQQEEPTPESDVPLTRTTYVHAGARRHE